MLKYMSFNKISNIVLAAACTGRLKSIITGLILLLIVPMGLVAQTAEISLSPDSIAPGRHSTLRLTATVPQGYHLAFPLLSDTLTSQIEIIHYGSTDTIKQEDVLLITREYRVTAWEDGYFAVPPLSIYLVDENLDSTLVESNPLLLEVSPVEVDLAAGLRDIKPIFRLPVSLRELLPWIIGLLVIVVAAVLLVRYLLQRKKAAPKESIWERPDIPAHVAAISSLQKLRNKKLCQNGKVKEYHTELTTIIRHYIEKRYPVKALEMTSGEILPAMEGQINDKEVISILQGILFQADLVKFARHMPEPSENDAAFEMAMEFVNRTTPVMQPDSGAPKGEEVYKEPSEPINKENLAAQTESDTKDQNTQKK
jgi:hypothetical protein